MRTSEITAESKQYRRCALQAQQPDTLTTRVARKQTSRPLYSIDLEEEASLRRAIAESRHSAPAPFSIPKIGESSGSASQARTSPDRRRSQ